MIRRLPRAVIERIAAGEVVERPASVVKELVENALDAGATNLAVSVEGGGLGLVRVADDGGGIAREELALAVASHATSKLADVDDLFHIASFGFRGEALASIAAVSHLRLVSATGEDGAGWCLECRGGERGEPVPHSAPRGTIVEVRDLLFNTPARRRFLGATSTEAARCVQLVMALSLVQPGIRWRLQVDGRLRFASDGADDLSSRLSAVYGPDFLPSLVPLASRAEGLALEGRLTLPAAARPRARAQLLFVNGRLVQDRGVSAALRLACKDFLPGALQPSWVLLLTVDPARIDVNVHPTKSEVRFRDRDAIFRLVQRAARDALLAADLAPRVKAEALGLGLHPAEAVGERERLPLAPAGSPRPQLPWAPVAPAPAAAQRAATTAPLPLGPVRAAVRYLQVLDSYLAHDGPDGLVLVDQHALHERILYARLQRQLEEGRLERQGLLVPVSLRLSPLDHARALERRDELTRLGLEIEDFGPGTVVLRAVPAVLRQEDAGDLLAALLDPPEAHGGIPHGLDRRLFTMACHAAVKAGEPLDEAQIAALLEQGAALEHDASCPHGRPTRLLIGRTELERLFKRTGF